MKNIEIVNAYGLLKSLKLEGLNDKTRNAIWNNIKVFRTFAEEYAKDKSVREKSLWDEKMQKPVEEYIPLEQKILNEKYKPTPEEEEKMRPVIAYLQKYNLQYNKAMAELDAQDVKVSNLIKIPENELLNLLQKKEGMSFNEMEMLSCICK